MLLLLLVFLEVRYWSSPRLPHIPILSGFTSIAVWLTVYKSQLLLLTNKLIETFLLRNSCVVYKRKTKYCDLPA